MALPRVALVGSPNVGKSTLFNRLIGKRQAVVADVAGTTRDRLEQIVDWHGRQFVLTDMAGLELSLEKDTEITRGTQAQVQIALSQADLLVWVVDATIEPERSHDRIASMLSKLSKPLIIAVNKCDTGRRDDSGYEFARYRHQELITLSAIHGRGVNELLDAITGLLPDRTETEEERELRLSIIGRPNVGKSTLLNTLVGSDRSVVSAEAGTTRDSVDTVIPAERLFSSTYTQWKQVRVIDTAGIRKAGKIDRGVESWSIIRTLEAVDSSDVALCLIDASEGVVHQDLQILQQAVDAGRAMVLVINKWDAVLAGKKVIPATDEDNQLQERFLDRLRERAPFLYWIQVLFVSAKDGLNVRYLGRLIVAAYAAWSLTVTQKELDDLAKALRQLPRLKNLRKIKLVHNRPPVFHLEIEGKALPHFSTIRSVENSLRERFDIGPTAIKIWAVPSIKRKDM